MTEVVKVGRIISVSGLIGSGKDTLAKYLIEDHGYKKMAFGSLVKDVVSALFGWDRQLLEGTTEEARAWRDKVDTYWDKELDFDVSVTPRWVLQNLATEVFRDYFHQDIWVIALKRTLMEAITSGQSVVITDTRFLNEFVMLQQMNATIVGIHRRVPHWAPDFYKEMEAKLLAHDLGPRTMDLSEKYTRDLVTRLAHTCPAVRKKVHSSEYLHMLWNKYDRIINNTSSLAFLRKTAALL